MITGRRGIWYASWQDGAAVIKCALPEQPERLMSFDLELLSRGWCAPSPRLRGEGWGEGESPRAEFVESPPHPPRKSAATSPRKRGEVNRTRAEADFNRHSFMDF
jgi:hypothetical protein